MITIKNSQRKFSIDQEMVKAEAQMILETLGYGDFDLGIWFTTNKTIRYYNATYRKKDKPTDILSFPYHEGLTPGQRIEPIDEDEKTLGDLLISVEFVYGLLPLYTVTLQKRITTLLIHGICHLLGYSHYDENNDKIMSALEKKLAKHLAEKS